MYEREFEKESTFLSFGTETEFYDFLEEMEHETRWIKSNYVSLGVLKKDSTPCPVLLSNTAQWDKACENGELGVELKDLSDSVFKSAVFNKLVAPLSANERAGAKCLLTQKYLESQLGKYAALITDGIYTLGNEKLLLLVRGGQVMAIHTSKYTVLRQKEVFQKSEDEMKVKFSKCRFISATYDHDVTHMSLAICNGNADFMEAYAQAWKDAGLPDKMLNKTYPIIDFSTSDTGRYTFSIRPLLKIGNKTYPIGTEITTKHCKSASLDSVGESINACFSEMQENLTTIVELQKQKLCHPHALYVRVCEKVGLTKKIKTILLAALDDFKSKYSEDAEITAFSVYREICDIQDKIEFGNLSPASKLQCLEMFSRLLKLDWNEMDKSGPETFN